MELSMQPLPDHEPRLHDNITKTKEPNYTVDWEMWLWAHAVSSWAWVKNRNETEAGLTKLMRKRKEILNLSIFEIKNTHAISFQLKTTRSGNTTADANLRSKLSSCKHTRTRWPSVLLFKAECESCFENRKLVLQTNLSSFLNSQINVGNEKKHELEEWTS